MFIVNLSIRTRLFILFSDIHLYELYTSFCRGKFIPEVCSSALVTLHIPRSFHLHNIAIGGQMRRDYGSLTKSLLSDRTQLVDFSPDFSAHWKSPNLRYRGIVNRSSPPRLIFILHLLARNAKVLRWKWHKRGYKDF